MNWVRHTLFLLFLALLASPAQAQRVAPDGVPYRAWDLDFGAGVHFSDRRDASIDRRDSFSNGWESYGSVTADLGYYFTDHRKVEVGFATFSTGDDVTDDPFVLPDGRTVQAFRQLQVRQTQVVVAATYQFLENGFTHPYISGGLRVGVLDIHSSRYPWGYIAGTSFTQVEVPPDPQHVFELRARPFIAVGSKSYFNERVFVRPEFAAAVNSGGLSQVALRLGAGVDF